VPSRTFFLPIWDLGRPLLDDRNKYIGIVAGAGDPVDPFVESRHCTRHLVRDLGLGSQSMWGIKGSKTRSGELPNFGMVGELLPVGRCSGTKAAALMDEVMSGQTSSRDLGGVDGST
jgi:hypothetical protein